MNKTICDRCGAEIVDKNNAAKIDVSFGVTEFGGYSFSNIQRSLRDVDLCEPCATELCDFLDGGGKRCA